MWVGIESLRLENIEAASVRIPKDEMLFGGRLEKPSSLRIIRITRIIIN